MHQCLLSFAVARTLHWAHVSFSTFSFWPRFTKFHYVSISSEAPSLLPFPMELLTKAENAAEQFEDPGAQYVVEALRVGKQTDAVHSFRIECYVKRHIHSLLVDEAKSHSVAYVGVAKHTYEKQQTWSWCWLVWPDVVEHSSLVTYCLMSQKAAKIGAWWPTGY